MMKKKIVYHIEISYRINKCGARQHVRLEPYRKFQTYEEAEAAVQSCGMPDEWYDIEFSISKTWQKDEG